MPSRNTYHLTWVSLTLDKGYLLTDAPPNLGRGVAPSALLHPHSNHSLDVGLLLSATTPDLGLYLIYKQQLEMGIPDHLTCLLRNLYAGQEATV